jgi:hypothetical protein
MADAKIIIQVGTRQVRVVTLGLPTALRELRASLLEISIWLSDKPDAHALLAIAVGRLQAERIHTEFESARRVIEAGISNRLVACVLERPLADPRDHLPAWLHGDDVLAAIQRGQRTQTGPARPAFPAVLQVMVQALLGGEQVRTRTRLGDITGLCYPAVARALEEIGDLVDDGYQQLRLRDFPREAWERLFATRRTWRRQHAYCVGTGTAFKPERILRNIQELGSNDLAVGGVVGARALGPIDLVGIPRLDVAVLAREGMMDLRWIEQVAPELRQCGPGEVPHLVAHAVRRPEPLFLKTSSGTFADRAEILLDLQDLRLDEQAATFLRESMASNTSHPKADNDR